MKVHVGSKNKTKIEAVTQVLAKSLKLKHAKVFGFAVEVPEFGHPKSLEETIQGAMDRAKKAFQDCDLSVGIEGGLMAVPHTKTGFMETTACAFFDGEKYHIGLAPGLEWPKVALHKILHEGLDGSQAFKAAGFTHEEKVGVTKGIVAVLTNGAIDRTQYNQLAVQMALVHLENPELY